jgi:hypothetical protein
MCVVHAETYEEVLQSIMCEGQLDIITCKRKVRSKK